MIYARVRVLTTIFTNNSNNKVKRVAARCEDLCRRDVCATGMNYSCGHIDIIDCPSVFALTRKHGTMVAAAAPNVGTGRWVRQRLFGGTRLCGGDMSAAKQAQNRIIITIHRSVIYFSRVFVRRGGAQGSTGGPALFRGSSSRKVEIARPKRITDLPEKLLMSGINLPGNLDVNSELVVCVSRGTELHLRNFSFGGRVLVWTTHSIGNRCSRKLVVLWVGWVYPMVAWSIAESGSPTGFPSRFPRGIPEEPSSGPVAGGLPPLQETFVISEPIDSLTPLSAVSKRPPVERSAESCLFGATQ
ncbi:hypothetical protein GEV33_009582 [Tenebrio molitor]|uniref:Uncharacterized protein n=1 Tax=Tenebrio molitor TaxID=7067 RepID=A0A8J6HEI8_TENMO|nr:hypothetical protein GEV33_009582 [Tenebrio molitor]